MFDCIKMLNYKRPLRERLATRKRCGPYMWTPNKLGDLPEGFGFYQASKGLYMDEHGSICDLRIEEANDHLTDHGYGSLVRINGYYTNDFQDETLKPIIARLPHGKGFLAGWTMGRGMCASLERYIWPSVEEAARAAHGEAESAAERQREYEESQREEEDGEEE